MISHVPVGERFMSFQLYCFILSQTTQTQYVCGFSYSSLAPCFQGLLHFSSWTLNVSYFTWNLHTLHISCKQFYFTIFCYFVKQESVPASLYCHSHTLQLLWCSEASTLCPFLKIWSLSLRLHSLEFCQAAGHFSGNSDCCAGVQLKTEVWLFFFF